MNIIKKLFNKESKTQFTTWAQHSVNIDAYTSHEIVIDIALGENLEDVIKRLSGVAERFPDGVIDKAFEHKGGIRLTGSCVYLRPAEDLKGMLLEEKQKNAKYIKHLEKRITDLREGFLGE